MVPPLESVGIQAIKEPFGSELDDLELGFGKTLKVLHAIRYNPQGTHEGSLQSIAIGRGWRMPVLEFMSVQMVSERLEVDSELLAHCGKLKCLHLRGSL